MMFKDKFVVSVKAGGKVLREFGDTSYVPFGSEFSIYLKNLNSRRASVKVSIDGNDVLNGSELIINANESIDLERFLKDANKGNRFKFIERTASIEQYRGIGTEDGLIRVEFAFEKEKYIAPYPIDWRNPGYNPWGYDPRWYGTGTGDRLGGDQYGGTCELGEKMKGMSNNVLRSSLDAVGSTSCKASVATFSANSCSVPLTNSTPVANEAGITVPGSESNQKFTTVAGFATDPSQVIVLKLVGELGQNKVVKAVTVKAKPTCQTCGRVNKATSKFCSECGTSLNIL